MTKDVLGFLSGKKTSKSTTAPKTIEAQQKPVNAPKPKAKPEKAPKPKKVKAKAQQQTTHQPHYQLSDFRMQTTADNIGIRITTLYLNIPIHQFILPAAQYAKWQRANPQIKYSFVQSRTLASSFFGDLRLAQAVVMATVNAIDDLFIRARQAQAQQHAQKRN